MSGNTTKYTPSEVLRVVAGLHRKRLYDMMKNGDISYELANGKRLLDGVELTRVFGSNFYPHGTEKTERGNTEKQEETERNSPEILSLQHAMALLQQQHHLQEALLHEKERMIDSLSRERDEWREQAKTHTRLLTESRAQETPSLWVRLFGTRR